MKNTGAYLRAFEDFRYDVALLEATNLENEQIGEETRSEIEAVIRDYSGMYKKTTFYALYESIDIEKIRRLVQEVISIEGGSSE